MNIAAPAAVAMPSPLPAGDPSARTAPRDVRLPAPGEAPNVSQSHGFRLTWDVAGDRHGALETNVRVTPDGVVSFASNGGDRGLGRAPSADAAEAVRRYVGTFVDQDAPLRALGSGADVHSKVRPGEFRLLVFRREGDAGETRQVVRGQLDALPNPIRDVLAAAADLHPHLDTRA